MRYRLIKSATTVIYFCLLCLTWLFFDGGLDVRFGLGAVLVSGCWLIVTRLQIGHLLETYYDILSRMEIEVPLVLGMFLSGAAMFAAMYDSVKMIAALEFIGWMYVSFKYKENRDKYEKQGHGPLPKGCWLSPPAAALKAGDLMLTSGRVATNLHEGVGHGEMVIEEPNGEMKSFSSYMKDGLVLNPLDAIARSSAESGYYIILRMKTPWTKEQRDKAAEIAHQMLLENAHWRDATNARRTKLINSLPLSQSMKEWLLTHTRASGYDWLGLFFGRLAKEHWTCIGACLELYRRLGIKTNQYGTGLLGLGSTIFDPIMPVRFLSDPALQMLSLDDKAAFEKH